MLSGHFAQFRYECENDALLAQAQRTREQLLGPSPSNESRETKGQNRRIELIIVPNLSQLPGFEELKALDAKQ